MSDIFKKSTKKNSDGSITNVICNSAKNGLIPQREYFDKSIANSDNTDGYYIIEQGDFVYNPRKSSDAPYGPVSIYKYPESGIVSPLYLCFRALKSINSSFYDYFFKSPSWHRYIYLSGDSGARHDRVSIKDDVFFSMPVNIPAEEEQAKIASFLGLIEERIAQQQLLVDSLKKYKRGAITLILSNKDASWKSGRLGDFITINRGGSPRPIEAFITNDPDGVNWVKIGDVSEDSLYITQTAEKITAEGSRKSRKVFAGDLILSNSMSFGRPYIMQIEGCIHDGWLLLRDDGACFDKKYLCYYLASDDVLAQYKKYAAGSCVSNLNSELVSNVFIEFPPLEKQKEIASSLELLDERINCEIKLLDKLLLIKKGLLQSLFI